MNELQATILALLVSTFPGVRKDGLQQMAAVISLQAADEKEATEIVGKLTADKVTAFVKDWRSKADAEIAKANQTHEAGLREKYDFTEKGNKPEPGKGEGNKGNKGGEPEALTLDAVSKLISEKLEGLTQSVTAITNANVAATRRAQFVEALDKSKVEGRQRDMMMRNFDRANTFATDEDFNAYLTEAQGDIAAIAQETANRGLQGHEAPIFGAVNKDGVSSGVADYIKAQTETKPGLTGKEI